MKLTRGWNILICSIALSATHLLGQGTHVRMTAYSLDLPSGWWREEGTRNDRLWACNKHSGHCSGTGGGFPLPGVVSISLIPVGSLPDGRNYKSIEDIVSAVPHAGMPAPEVNKVELRPIGGSASLCMVARSLLPGGVWDEVYGVSVGGKLFRALVQYNNEPSREESYRHAVIDILSSLSLNVDH